MFVSYFEPEKMLPGRGESDDVCISRNYDSQARKLIFFFFSNDEDHGPRKIDLQIKVMAGFLGFFYSTIGTCLAGASYSRSNTGRHCMFSIRINIIFS